MAFLALFHSVFNTSTIESLNEEEILLASLIFENAQEVVTSLPNVPIDEVDGNRDFPENFEITRRNLLDIIDAFNKAQKARKNFQKYFPAWASSRQANVSKLRELADCVNEDRFICNVAKITGSAVGIVGGAAAIASIAFPPAALLLAAGGGITSLLGGATVFGTSVKEIVFLNEKMKEAKDILEQDKEKFKPMAEWFKHSQDLKDLIEQIIGFDVVREVFEGLKKFKDDFISLFSLKQGALPSKIKELIKIFIQKAAPAGVAAAHSELLFQIPLVIAFVFVMILFRKSNNLLFDCIVITHRTVFELAKVFDITADLGMLICNAAMKTGVASTEVITKASAKLVARGVFAGIGIALDVTNLVLASIDVYEGSVSEKAVQLKAVSDKLENELWVVKTVIAALF